MSRIIAIDYGKKRVGLAVTDPLQLIASGLTTVAAYEVIDYLKTYVEQEDVNCFVVGEPKQMNHTASESTPMIERFIKDLREAFPHIPIEREDERFTSKMAFQSLIDSGLKKKDRANKALVDEVSATLILQSYLARKS